MEKKHRYGILLLAHGLFWEIIYRNPFEGEPVLLYAIIATIFFLAGTLLMITD